MKKVKVGVLMGGLSIEKEVSFNSGRTICDHLDTAFYDVIPIFQTTSNQLFLLPWRFLHRGKISDFEHRLANEANQIKWDHLKVLVDFVYIAVHGRYAEDGTLQGFLEVLGIPYLGAKVLGSALSMNKVQQKEILASATLTVPRGIAITPAELKLSLKDSSSLLNKLKKQNLSFPLIVKPNHEGSSLGVSVVFKEAELIPALEGACNIHPGEQQTALIEEKIEGMEFSCITLFDKNGAPILLPPTEVVHEPGTHFHDYQQKYMPGKTRKYTPARVEKKILAAIQKACLQTSKLLEFETISRIDGFVKKDGTVVIVDPNSLSGMAPSSFLFNQAAEINMSHTDLINHLIEVELHRQGKTLSAKSKKKTIEKKLRVVVLLGGDSTEREISLESGRNVCYKLSPHKYEVIPIFVNSKRELYPLTQKLLVHNSTADIERDLDQKTKINWNDLPKIGDFVFIGLHGGVGENGSVQGTLEMLGLPYNGPGISASALCMDKVKTANFLKMKGLAVPQSICITPNEWELSKQELVRKMVADLELPVIVKPHDDGCSMGVSKASTEKELIAAIQNLFKTKAPKALIEECIKGMELTVGVIGNTDPKALPPSQAVATGGILSIEEKFLPGAGENQTPAPLSKAATLLVQQTVVAAYKAIDCVGYSRIDCFYQTAAESKTGKEQVVILEINTLPGLTPATCIFHQAAEIGIKPMDFVDLIISFGLQIKKRESKSTSRGAENENQTTINTLNKSELPAGKSKRR